MMRWWGLFGGVELGGIGDGVLLASSVLGYGGGGVFFKGVLGGRLVQRACVMGGPTHDRPSQWFGGELASIFAPGELGLGLGLHAVPPN